MFCNNLKHMILKIYGVKYEVKQFGANSFALTVGDTMVTGKSLTELQNNTCKKMGIVQVKTHLYLTPEKSAQMESLFTFPAYQEINQKAGNVNNPIFTFKKESLAKLNLSHPFFNKCEIYGNV